MININASENRREQFNVDKAIETLLTHKRQRLFNKRRENDIDLTVIFDYHLHLESDVIASLSNVENRLCNFSNIPPYDYERLAFCLIRCNTILQFDYSLCKERMIKNICSIYDQEKEKYSDIFSWTVQLFDFNNEEEKKQFINFMNDVTEALNATSRDVYNFSYSPNDLVNSYDYVYKNIEQVISNHRFISKFDLGKLLNMIFDCEPLYLQKL